MSTWNKCLFNKGPVTQGGSGQWMTTDSISWAGSEHLLESVGINENKWESIGAGDRLEMSWRRILTDFPHIPTDLPLIPADLLLPCTDFHLQCMATHR